MSVNYYVTDGAEAYLELRLPDWIYPDTTSLPTSDSKVFINYQNKIQEAITQLIFDNGHFLLHRFDKI